MLYWGLPGGSDCKASACNAGDPGSIPGSGRSPGEGNGNPLQYSCLENSMDGGAWKATVHGVAKNQTWLSDFTYTVLVFFFLTYFTLYNRLQFHPPHLDRWILNILSLLCLSNIYFFPSETEERITHLSCCIHQQDTQALLQRILELMSLLNPSPSCCQGPWLRKTIPLRHWSPGQRPLLGRSGSAWMFTADKDSAEMCPHGKTLRDMYSPS